MVFLVWCSKDKLLLNVIPRFCATDLLRQSEQYYHTEESNTYTYAYVVVMDFTFQPSNEQIRNHMDLNSFSHLSFHLVEQVRYLEAAWGTTAASWHSNEPVEVVKHLTRRPPGHLHVEVFPGGHIGRLAQGRPSSAGGIFYFLFFAIYLGPWVPPQIVRDSQRGRCLVYFCYTAKIK